MRPINQSDRSAINKPASQQEHFDWNAPDEKTKVRIELVGGAALRDLLQQATTAQQVAT